MEYLTYDKDEEREAPVHQPLGWDARGHNEEDPSAVELGQSEPHLDARFHEAAALHCGDIRRKLQKNHRRFQLPVPAASRDNEYGEYYTN